MSSNILISLIFIICLFILIAISAFFTFSEMCLASLSTNKLTANYEQVSQQRQKKVNLILKVFNSYNNSISTIVIWTNIINILATTLATTWFAIIMSGSTIGPIISFIVMSFSIIIFAELIPKMLGRKYPEEGMIKIIYPIYFIIKSFEPVSNIFGRLIKERPYTSFDSQEQFQQAILEASQLGLTTKRESDLIRNSLLLDQTKVSAIMTPFQKMAFIYKQDLTIENIDKLIINESYTRFPILNKNNTPYGIFNVKAYLRLTRGKTNNLNLNKLVYEFLVFNENDLLDQVFTKLRHNRLHMGFVVNNQKKVIGIITIESIVELIVGQLYDETDEEKDGVYEISLQSWLVKPNVKVNKLFNVYIKEVNIENKYRNMKMETFFKSLRKKQTIKLSDYVIYKNLIIWVKNENKLKNKINYIFEIDLINKNDLDEIIEELD